MAGTHQQFLDHIALGTKNRMPNLSAGHRHEVFASMLNMTYDISGSSDTKCVALSGLRYALGNRSGALRHPAGAVRTLRAQDGKPVVDRLNLLIAVGKVVRTLRARRKTKNNWRSQFVSVTRVSNG
jgi:hypothetical protein